jgi:hypothetical protein
MGLASVGWRRGTVVVEDEVRAAPVVGELAEFDDVPASDALVPQPVRRAQQLTARSAPRTSRIETAALSKGASGTPRN